MPKPRVIAVSSLVAHGSVGLRAILPALDALGCEATAIPTVVLSNHPGHAHAAGERMGAELLDRIAGALEANGWFKRVPVLLTGYLPSIEHVAFAAGLQDSLRAANPDGKYVLDPVLGDDPKGLYIAADAAEAVRTKLLKRADVITPNRFELGWLSGRDVSTVEEAVAAARRLGVPAVIATSIPCGSGSDELATVLVTPDAFKALSIRRRAGVAHGTGDVLAGLFSGFLARGDTLNAAFEKAHTLLASVIEASGEDMLDLSALTGAGALT